MKEQFVPYEQALKLKELGFDELCFASYYTDVEENKTEKYDVRKKLNASFDWNPFTDEEDSGYILNSDKEYYVSAPLWQQAFDWIRVNKNIQIHIFIFNNQWYFNGRNIKNDSGYFDESNNKYPTYEEARLACLEKLIEVISAA